MIATLVICGATVAAMICGVLFFPKIKLGPLKIDSYWVITLLGACILLASGQADVAAVGKALVADTAVNPLKILVLFISMTVLSVFLDELGFFRFLASAALRKAGSGQKKLFLYLYATVSVLTVFTSNDVIILSFTPFICYFAKTAKINPMPYLAAEFVAANTWSMLFIIGNPTNIYLATSYGEDFANYLKLSLFPTLFAGTCAFFVLYILFRKKLSAPIVGEAEDARIENKPMLAAGIIHLAVCTVFLAVGSYIGVEMWIVSACAVGSLAICALIMCAAQKKKPKELSACFMRAPWQLVPFVLAMFVLIEGLGQNGATRAFADFLGSDFAVLKYGVSSFFASNLINNIPMSVLYSSVLNYSDAGLGAMFATVIGSNLGAFLTPVGALAGIMFSAIAGEHGVKFGYVDFLKTCAIAAVPALFAALGGLYLALLCFG